VNRDDTHAAVLAIVADIAAGEDVTAVDPDEDLRDALDLDSMDLLFVAQEIEKRLGVSIPELDYPRLTTLGAIVDYVAARGPSAG